jgi:hypothetical protein
LTTPCAGENVNCLNAGNSRNQMKIACIGWGSLIWNHGALHCRGDWSADGPVLPIEFARTSRDGRLTLVLTAEAKPVPALWVELDYKSAIQAQEALAGREACDLHSIGVWPGIPPRYNVGAASIAAWAAERQLDAVVWTALRPKFSEQDGVAPDSAQAAIEYLRRLAGAAQVSAREYIQRAPAQIRTLYRAAIESELGWRDIRG